jgi:hypothetical protein
MNDLRQCAFRIDPVLWVQKVLGEDPTGWQRQFLRASRGASILALTARQVGKTTAACWAMAHTAIYQPGSLSVVACPAQRQSAEAIRRVRDSVAKAGAALIVANVYGLELENGARVLALPGTDDSVRGLTVDGWGGAAFAGPDRRVAPDAGAKTAGAICDAVDRLEPHRSILDSLGQRRQFVYPPQGHGRYRRQFFLGRFSRSRASSAR